MARQTRFAKNARLPISVTAVCLATLGMVQAQDNAAPAPLPITKVQVVLDDSQSQMRVTHGRQDALGIVGVDLPAGITTFPDNLIVTSPHAWQATVVEKEKTSPSDISDDSLDQLRKDLNGKEVQVQVREQDDSVSGKVSALDKTRMVVERESDEGIRDIVRTSKLSRVQVKTPKKEGSGKSTHQLILRRNSTTAVGKLLVSYSIDVDKPATHYIIRLPEQLPHDDKPRVSLHTVIQLENKTGMAWKSNTKIDIHDGKNVLEDVALSKVDPGSTVHIQSASRDLAFSAEVEIPVAYTKATSEFFGDAKWRLTVNEVLPLRDVRIAESTGYLRYATALKLDASKAQSIVEFPYRPDLDGEAFKFVVSKPRETVSIAALHGLWAEQCKALAIKVNIEVQTVPVLFKPTSNYRLVIEGQEDKDVEKAFAANKLESEQRFHLLSKAAHNLNLRTLSAAEITELIGYTSSTEQTLVLRKLSGLVKELAELESKYEKNLEAVAPDAGLARFDSNPTGDSQRINQILEDLQELDQTVPPKYATCDLNVLKQQSIDALREADATATSAKEEKLKEAAAKQMLLQQLQRLDSGVLPNF